MPSPADLPDPSESSRDLAPITNDELLSQLAGQEIDRLLAEVDAQIDAALAEENRPRREPVRALALRAYDPPPEEVDASGAPASDPPVAVPINWDDDAPPAPPASAGGLLHDDPLPLVLRPLEWINAPFVGISQAGLDALGKIAIVSFILSVASLAYVLLTSGA